MKKKMIFITVIALLFVTVTSCKENANNNELEVEENYSLLGTNWKLVGLVDAQTGNLTELEPKDCEECYTFTFHTNSAYDGFSASNILMGSYKIDYEDGEFYFTNIGGTEAGEMGDGHSYRKALHKIYSFSSRPGELNLYYNDANGKNYLKYKEMGE